MYQQIHISIYKKVCLDKGFRMISSRACAKKPFGAGTRQCMALLALALVYSFYQL